jgi:hypothetical protein
MVAARNGSACGKVWLTSSGPIAGLKAVAGDLKAADAAIPAAQVRVSYPTNWESTSWSQGPDILLDSPPAETPTGKAQVWISVKVPKDANPGVYTGQLAVEAKGLSRTVVPVKLDVRDWTPTTYYENWHGVKTESSQWFPARKRFNLLLADH